MSDQPLQVAEPQEGVLIEDIFISYSHKEKDFAEQLYTRLLASGYKAWGDWAIEGAHEWRKEIQQALEQTNTFIFVITPNSVDSEECRKEADYASHCKKRIIPIIHQDISDFRQLHPALEQHQCINFRVIDDFEKSFQKLIQAIKTDLAYARLHARLLQRALEWERGNYNESFLLSGEDLAGVRQKLVENVHKEPKLNALQAEYILTSGKVESARYEAESRKQRIGLIVIGTLLFLAIGGGMFAWVQYRLAKKETIKALVADSKTLSANGRKFDALKRVLKAEKQYTRSHFAVGDLSEDITSTLQYAIGLVRQLNYVQRHQVETTALIASPNGRFLASSDLDGKIIFWQLDGSTQPCFGGNGSATYDLAFSPDSRVLASVGQDGKVRFCYTDGRPMKTLIKKHDARAWEIDFSPDGRFLASSDDRGHIFLWSADGRFLLDLNGSSMPNTAVKYFSFSPNSQRLASASSDGTVKIWTAAGKLIQVLKEAHQDAVKHLAFSPQSDLLATAGADHKIKLWSVDGKPRQLKVFDESKHQDTVSRVAFSPDGQLIASAGYDKLVNLWKRDGTFIKTLSGPDAHRKIVNSITFSPDSQVLITGSRDKTIKLWQRDGTFLETLQGHTDWVKQVAVVPHQSMLTFASAGLDKTVRLWRINDTLVAKALGHKSTVQRVVFSHDGEYMASTDNDETLRIWHNGVQLIALKQQKVVSLAFHPNRLLLASGHSDGIVKLWQPQGSPWHSRVLGKQSGAIYQIRFSPNGEILGAVGEKGDARLWDIRRSHSIKLQGPKEHGANVNLWDIGFSPDGSKVVTTDDEGRIILWKTSGSYLRELSGHLKEAVYQVKFRQNLIVAASRAQVQFWKADGTLIPMKAAEQHKRTVWAIDVSPDNQLIASASTDNTVKLWHPSGRLVTTLFGHEAEVRDVRFSPDGKFLASASTDNTVKIWRKDGTLFKTLRGNNAPVMVAAFNSKGELATADEDGAILIWRSWHWDLKKLVDYSCSYLKGYIAQHPEDRSLCDRSH
jgi:WD40 repeat protein